MTKPHQVTEGILRAEKSTSNIDGQPNMWHLHVKNKNGRFESVQRMHVSKIQKFFKEELPVDMEYSKI